MSYPLKPVPPLPGPRPPRWRFRALRRWRRAVEQRQLAKKWNFGALYGAGPESIRVYEDRFPWTPDAYAQMFHRPSVTKRTDRIKSVVYDA